MKAADVPAVSEEQAALNEGISATSQTGVEKFRL